jgi:hypothetical protein
MAEALKTFSFPVGGIADFYLEDHEKEALYREKAQENFGTDGLGAIQDVAVRMASYGRYGDDKLVHAETGELVVPKALIEKNPKLKDSIFNHLKDMGIEDPERYVVGTEANSINPDTGLPEFFLKEVFDRVGDVIRKVAKPVLTVAGAVVLAPFVGPTAGASIGAGIGGLIQGESFEQALGSALTAGATATIGSGIAGMYGGTGFKEGVMSGFSRTPMGEVFSMDRFKPTGETTGDTAGSSIFQRGKDLLTGKTPTPEEILAAREKAGITEQAKILANNPTASQTLIDSRKILAGDVAEKALQPSFLRKYGPITALTALGTGFFDKPEMEELDDIETGQDLIDKNREKYIVENLELQSAEPPYEIPTMYPGLPGIPGIMRAEAGGPAFPRRTGGIGMDEGVKGKDSVRAMLMPGEFVMTTDAVNGAGDGDNEKGIKNMYAMMRSFEAKARA